MAVGDVYYAKWKIQDTGLGKIYVPGIHIRQDAVSFDANAVADDMIGFWEDSHGITGGFRVWYTPDNQLDAILIRRVDPIEPLEQEFTTGLPSVGTGGTQGSAPQNSILVTHRTAKIGRSYRGRVYFPSPTEDIIQADQSISATNGAELADQFEWLRGELSEVGQLTPMVVYSTKLSEANEVTSIRVDRRIRNQRRRQIVAPLYVTP